jgi:ABC-type multidrug transport system ATPase subunit
VSALATKGLSVRIGAAPIVRAVDLDLSEGVWCGLVGANGSGKTTLLRCLAGRLQPDAGEITLSGAPCAGDPARRAAEVGLTPAAERLPKGLTPQELLRVLELAAGARADDPAARALHRALGLDALDRTPIGLMSAGQKQRVAIRCAFVGAPRVVLLDEPFNWLDPAVAHDVKAAVRAVTHDHGVTVLSALHDTAVLAVWCDEGVLMAEGRVAARFGAGELTRARTDLTGFEADLVARLRRRS